MSVGVTISPALPTWRDPGGVNKQATSSAAGRSNNAPGDESD
jgi:hypothetical protein